MSASSASKRETIYAAIVEAARNNQRCPSNSALANLIGSSTSVSYRHIKKLVLEGRLIVHSGAGERVAVIPALGIRTAGLRPRPHWRELQGHPLKINLASGQVDLPERDPRIERLRREEKYRVAYLPRQLRATRRKLQMLCNEARRYGMTELLEDGE